MSAAACPNCGTPAGGGEFCAACGQRNRNIRLHASELLQQATDQVIEWRSPWLRTFAEMSWRPGRVALDYVEGRRVRYIDPVKYCFIVVAVAIAFKLVFAGDATIATGSKPAAIAALPGNVMALIAIPFEVLLLRLLFWRSARNATEIAVLCLFVTAQCVFIAQVLMLALERLLAAAEQSAAAPVSPYFITVVLGFIGALWAYSALGISQFFQARAWYAVIVAFAVGLGSLSMVAILGDFLEFGR